MSKNKSSKKTTGATKAAPRVKQPEKNGITEPREGGKTRAIWDICDALKKKLIRVPVRAEVIEAAPKGSKPNMVATQYGYWRRFNGISGRINLPKAPAAPKAPKAPKASKAAKKGGKKTAPKAPTPPAAPAAPKAPAAPVAPAPAVAAGK